MFNASYFTYDGVYSGEYGLQIASFDSQSVETTSVFSPTFTTGKASRDRKFHHNGIKYEQPPSFPFSIISEMPIGEVTRRDVLSWLVGRKQFKKLEIHQGAFADFIYRCVFSAVDIIYVNGQCHGFQVTATFDSWFCEGKPTWFEIEGNGATQTKKIISNSDIPDDYVYPSIELRDVQSYGTIVVGEDSKSLFCTIKNNTDNGSRLTQFYGLTEGDSVNLNGEARIVEKASGAGALSCFNKNWLRLKKGVNTLEITVNGTIRVVCPTYTLIGF